MADFDFDTYLANRYQNLEGDKLGQLAAASQEKITALGKYAQNIETAKVANKLRNSGSVISRLQDITGASDTGVLAHDGLIGEPINAAVALGSGFSKSVGYVASGLHDANAMLLNKDVPQEVKDAHARLIAKQATPEDMALLALPYGDTAKRAEPTDYKQKLRSDFKTNLQQVTDMQNEISTADGLRSIFDLSGAVHTGNKDALTKDLKSKTDGAVDTFRQGFNQVKYGEVGSGLLDMATGLGSAVSEIPGAAARNPLGALDFLSENGANLLMSGAGKIPQAISNVGYGLDAFGQGVAEHVKSKGGAMPTNEDLAWKALIGATAVGAEYAGDKLSGVTDLFKPVKKVLESEAKTALKQALGFVSNPVTRTTGAGFKGGSGEFFTEAYQTWAENAMKMKDTTLNESFEGGAIGAIIGGGTGVASHVGREITGTTEGKLETAAQTRKQRQDFAALAKANDITGLLDPKAKTHDPLKAVAILSEHAQLADTTPEVKTANLLQARQVVGDLAKQHQNNVNLLDTLLVPGELQAAKDELVAKKAELSTLDPANENDSARIGTLNREIAFREQVVALEGDRVGIKRLQRDIKRGESQLSTIKDVQENLADSLRTTVTAEELTNHIVLANRATAVHNMPDFEESQKSIQALIALSTTTNALQPKQALELANNKDNTLTTEQRAYFRQFSDARIVQNQLMTLDKVSQEVFTGTAKSTGIAEYRRTLGQAFEVKDLEAADRSITALIEFANDHAAKSAIANKYFHTSDTKKAQGGDRQILKIAGGGWEVKPYGKPLDKKELDKNGGFNIHPNSTKYVEALAVEAAALHAAAKEQATAYKLTFGEYPLAKIETSNASTSVATVVPATPTITPTASTTSVAQTPAAPSSATPVVSAVQSTPIPPVNNNQSGKNAEVELRPNTGQVAEATEVKAEDRLLNDNYVGLDTVKDVDTFINTVHSLWKKGTSNKVLQAKLDSMFQKGTSSSTDLASFYDGLTGGNADLSHDALLAQLNPEEQSVTDPTAEETYLAKLQPEILDRDLRILNTQEKSKLQVALEGISSVFKSEIDTISFFIQKITKGKNAMASSFKEHPVIGLNSVLFTADYLTIFDEATRLKFTIAHELAHERDKRTEYASELELDLNKDGVVYNEIKEVLSKGNVPKLTTIFKSTMIRPKLGVVVPVELYAHLHALNLVDPELLKKELPNGYAFIQSDLRTNPPASNGRGTNGEDQNTSTGTDQKPTTGTGDQGLLDRESSSNGSGVNGLPAGGLDALVAEAKSAPDTPYQQRNLLVDHFSQSVAGLTVASQRPLVMVKDFISSVRESLDFSGFLKDYKATEKQEAVLKMFVEKAGKDSDWSKAIQKLLVKGYFSKRTFKDNKDFTFRNPFSWMILGDVGNFHLDENTNTAVIYAAITTILELADNPKTNDDKTINAILGRDPEAVVPGEAKELLSDVGTLLNLVGNSAGKTGISALGMKVDDDAGQNLMPQLESGMGGLVIAMLQSLNLVEQKDIAAVDMNTVIAITNEMDGKDGEKANNFAEGEEVRRFLNLKRDPETGEFTEEVKGILEALRGSNNVLDKLMSVEAQLQYPSFTPIVNTQKKTKTGQEVPDLLNQTNDQNREQKNFARQDMWKLLQAVEPIMYGLAGVEEVSETKTQKTKRRGIEAKNDGLLRELARYKDYMNDVLLVSAKGIEQAIYFDYSVWLQQRVGIATNVINPQTSKAHRALFYRKDWESEIMFDNYDMLDNFLLRVGEGLGVKTERDDLDNSIEKINAILEQDVVQEAIDSIQTILYTDKGISEDEQKNLLAAVKIGGENFHTLDALVAMAHYYQAKGEGKPSFITHIQAEVDGVTNGPILAHAMFGAARGKKGADETQDQANARALSATLARGGLYTKEDNAETFNEWKANPLNQDLYEHTILTLIRAISSSVGSATNPKIKALYFFTGSLDKKDGNASSEGRKFIKGPVTKMVFGEGLGKSLNSLAEGFLDSVYDVLEQAANGSEKYPPELAIAAYNELIGDSGDKLTLANLKNFNENFSFDAQEKAKLKEEFGNVFNEPVTAVIRNNFGHFTRSRNMVTQLAELTHGLYATVYDTLREQMVNKLIAAEKVKPGTGIAVYHSGHTRDLSKKEERQLEKQVASMFPMVQTMFSLESNQPKAGLRIGKFKKHVSNKTAYETKGNYSLSNSVSQSMIVRSLETVHEEPGAAMAPLLVHSSDSYVSHSTQLGMELLNIHDAVIAGVMTIREAATKMNQQTFHLLINYSPLIQMYYALENTVNGLDQVLDANYSETDPVKQATFNAITASVNAFLIDYASSKKLETNNVLLEMLTRAKESAAIADTIKLNTLHEITHVNQYAKEKGSYVVTDENRTDIKQKLSEVNKDIDPKTQRSVERINEWLPEFKVLTIAKETKAHNMPDMEPMEPVTNTYSTHDIYNALDTNAVSAPFDAHLRNILTNIVEKLHGAFGSFKDTLMKDSPKAAIDIYSEALATGKAPYAFSLGAKGFVMSSQQTFVADQIHATILAALNNNDARNAVVYSELSKLYRETRTRLEGTAWTTDPATKPLYDMLFNELPTNTADRDNYLAEFAALGLAHEEFNKLLQVPTSMAPAIMKDRTIAGMLGRLLSKVLEFFNAKMTHTVAGQNADVKLKSLVQQLVNIENRHKLASLAPQGVFTNFIDKQALTWRAGKKDVVSKLMHSNMFMKNRNVFIAAASGVIATIADSQVGTFFKVIDNIRNENFSGKQGIIAGFLAEMNGPKPSLQALIRGIKYLEGQRKKIITLTNKFVLNGFDKQGQDMDTDDKKAVTKVLLHTGAHTLLDHFDTLKLETLLKDDAAMKAEIATFEKMLNTYTPAQKNFFIEQSRALGYYLVTGKVTHEMLLKNANNIANMYMSPLEGSLSKAQVATATKTIDALTSLYALNYTSPKDKTSMVKTLAQEHARTDGGNGVRLILLAHKEMEQRAKDKLFGSSATLMVKGYVTEIYNPHTDIKAANEVEGKILEDLGYKKGALVKNDPSDTLAEVKHLYVMHDGAPMPWLSGIFSFTGMRSKGTKHHGKNATNTQQAITQDKLLAVANRTGNAGSNFDPTKVKHNHMAPLLNDLGQAVNYQYLMQSSTKELLDRDTRFDSVMGALNGSIFDKENAADHNRKAVQVMFDEFTKTYNKEPKAYMRVGASSKDSESREIYQMLPQATKDAIREIWGKDEMMVRASNMDIAFGYRKLTLSTVFDKEEEDRNFAEKTLVWWSEATLKMLGKAFIKVDGKRMTDAQGEGYAKRASLYARRGENVWRELVKETKDIFVIKSGMTAVANIVSNMTLLKLYGVPTVTALKDMQIAWVNATAYTTESARLFELETMLSTQVVTTGLNAIKQEIRALKDSLSRNPIGELIEAGLMPTIVEDVSAEEDIYSYKSQFVRKTEKHTNKLNKHVVKAGKQVYMAHDTGTYKTIAEITRLSDFVARYALYQHLTSKKDEPFTKEKAIQEASDAFINYDVPMHRDLQYLDDMGIAMFTKYFMRIQRVIRGRFKNAPGKVAMLLLAQGYLDWLPTALDSSIIFRFGNNPLSWGALQFPSSLDQLGTVKAGMSLFR